MTPIDQVDALKQALETQIDGVRSKHVSVPLLSLAIACRRSIIVQNVPDIGDLQWVCAAARMIGDAIEFDRESLIYSPRPLSQHEQLDLTKHECSLRQSLILAPLAMHVSQLLLPLPSGDAIGIRPIQAYNDVLTSFNLELLSTEDSLRVVNRRQFGEPQSNRIRLSVASTGVTFVALGCCLNASSTATTLIMNASSDPEVRESLQACGIAHNYDDKSRSLEVNGPLPISMTAKIPLDRIALSELLLATIIHNRPSLFEVLVPHIGTRMGCAFLGVVDEIRMHQVPGHTIKISASQFPGISTDILPALCVTMWLRSIAFRAEDFIFERRLPMLRVAMEAISAHGLEERQSGFAFAPRHVGGIHPSNDGLWRSANIRQTSSGLLALLAPNSHVSKVSDETGSIFRAYTNHWFRSLELISGRELNSLLAQGGPPYLWRQAEEIRIDVPDGTNSNNARTNFGATV